MPHFDQQDLADLENLCRIRCTPEEEKELLVSLGKILDYVHQLNEVDTRHVLACNDVLKEMAGPVMREDEAGELISREEFLSNAPDHIGSMIRVPTILKTL
jgi:aspartyl-tRNA(Asn)/glutamyl-tRNA(Gln) amidotransferase subunit C